MHVNYPHREKGQLPAPDSAPDASCVSVRAVPRCVKPTCGTFGLRAEPPGGSWRVLAYGGQSALSGGYQ